MRIPSLENNIRLSNSNPIGLSKNSNDEREVCENKPSLELTTIRNFNIDIKELSREEELDIEKLNKIKQEMESINISSDLLADVLISSFLNNRG